MTYHEMLGTPYEPNPFVVDVAALKNQFRAVQAVVHPDRWVAKPPVSSAAPPNVICMYILPIFLQEHQAIAAAMSSRINEALHRLSDPLRRAEYILAREGYAGEETDKLDDMELLMEVMEAREGLANAQSEDEVADIRAKNDGVLIQVIDCVQLIYRRVVKIAETVEEIEKIVGEKDWEALRTAAVKLKYLQGIESAAAAWPAHVLDR